MVTFPADAIFQFIPSTYTVAEDVVGERQTVSLQLISGVLAANIDLQVTVTGGTAAALGRYHWCVGKKYKIHTLLQYQCSRNLVL